MAPLAVTLARRFLNDLLSTGNWAEGPDLLHADIVMHHPASPDPLTPITSYAAVQAALHEFRKGFPNLHITIHDAFGNDERAVVRWHANGTNSASMYGAPATHKTIHVNGISIARVENGKIVELWVAEDTHGMMRQLGWA